MVGASLCISEDFQRNCVDFLHMDSHLLQGITGPVVSFHRYVTRLSNPTLENARKALEGLNRGGGRNGGRRGIPEDVDLDQIRDLFNRR